MFLDDREVSCPAGSFVFIPAEIPHGFRVGDVPSRKLNFYFPAVMIGYFDELSAAIRNGDVDERGLRTLHGGTRWKSSARCRRATSDRYDARATRRPDRSRARPRARTEHRS